ncbi:MAG: Sec-independent protein translocase protein TatB [Nitrospirota bacterium]
MFDIGMPELIVIFIVALLVFGPKRLPELGRAVGKGLAELKRSLHDVKKQVETEFKETTSDIQEAKRSLQDVKEQVETGLKETIDTSDIQEIKRSLQDVKEQVEAEVKETIDTSDTQPSVKGTNKKVEEEDKKEDKKEA